MDREQWAKLTPEEQRTKVAECQPNIYTVKYPNGKESGPYILTDMKDGCEPCGGWGVMGLPDWLNDLNAMHEAEMSQFSNLQFREVYRTRLTHVVMDTPEGSVFYATAAQRAEAFVLTMEQD